MNVPKIPQYSYLIFYKYMYNIVQVEIHIFIKKKNVLRIFHSLSRMYNTFMLFESCHNVANSNIHLL